MRPKAKLARLCILGSLVTIALFAQAKAEEDKSFLLSDLIQLVKAQQPKSIEELLPLLPEDLRSNFTLMYKSQSIQGADPMRPRAIAFNSDGRLIITFNGDGSQKGGNDIEVMAFHDETAEFEMREIHFDPKAQQTAKISKKNPSKCVACHGEPARPIWDRYPLWRGAYGGSDDNIGGPSLMEKINTQAPFAGKAEQEAYLKMKQQAITHPRYQHLVWHPAPHKQVSDSDYYPYFYANKKTSSSEYHLTLRPNTKLGLLLNAQNAKKIVEHKLKTIPGYQKVALSFLIDVENCPSDSRNPKLRTKLYYPKDYIKSYYPYGYADDDNLDNSYATDILKYAEVHYRKELDIKFKQYIYTNENHERDYYNEFGVSTLDGFHTPLQTIASAIYQDLKLTKLQASSILQAESYQLSQEEGLSNRLKVLYGPHIGIKVFSSEYNRELFKKDCAMLYEKLRELPDEDKASDENAKSTSSKQAKMDSIEALSKREDRYRLAVEQVNKAKPAFKSCLHCHGEVSGIAPQIPFHRPGNLLLQENHKRLKQEILRRINLPLEHPEHMPPKQELSTQDKLDIEDFLQLINESEAQLIFSGGDLQ